MSADKSTEKSEMGKTGKTIHTLDNSNARIKMSPQTVPAGACYSLIIGELPIATGEPPRLIAVIDTSNVVALIVNTSPLFAHAT